MPDDNQDTFDSNYKTFLEILRGMVGKQIENIEREHKHNHDRDRKLERKKAVQFADIVFDALQSEQAVRLMCGAADAQSKVVREAIVAELEYFNVRYPVDHAPTEKSFQAAHTVKTSLHGVFGSKLPGWLKKLLTILNELLSLLKP